jgi:hypothetical protein
MKNIIVRFEGGIGDCLLANRFLFAIKEAHPDSNIKVAFDTGVNNKQEKLMKHLWPSTYVNTYTIGEKLNPQFITKNNEGRNVNYVNHPDNLPNKFKEDIKSSDIFYDLHIASLKFFKYDIPWMKYYWYFPKPEVVTEYKGKLPEKFILVHFYPRPDSFHSLDQSQAINLINELKKILPVVIICEEKYFDWYKGCSEWIIDPKIEEIFYIASKCEIFVGADSSIRYIPLHFGKASFVLSKHCQEPFRLDKINLHHLCRWSLYRNLTLPANIIPEIMGIIASNIVKNKGYFLFPEIGGNLESIIGDQNLP